MNSNNSQEYKIIKDEKLDSDFPPQRNNINWKYFAFAQDEKTLYATYWGKDYFIQYKSKAGILRVVGYHYPYAYPRSYTEESVIRKCIALFPCFLKAEKYIEENSAILEKKIEQFKTEDSKSQSHKIHEWVEQNIEGRIQQIIERYINSKL